MQWLPLPWVDVAMLGVFVLSALVGLVRGITFELLSLAGWFAAYLAGRWLGPFIAPYLPLGAAGSALNLGAAFACAFILVLIAWTLMARFVSALIGATPLRPLDRLLGAAFGLARGVLVLLAVAALIAYTPAVRSAAWQESTGARVLESLLRQLLPVLPAHAVLPGPAA